MIDEASISKLIIQSYSAIFADNFFSKHELEHLSPLKHTAAGANKAIDRARKREKKRKATKTFLLPLYRDKAMMALAESCQ